MLVRKYFLETFLYGSVVHALNRDKMLVVVVTILCLQQLKASLFLSLYRMAASVLMFYPLKLSYNSYPFIRTRINGSKVI